MLTLDLQARADAATARAGACAQDGAAQPPHCQAAGAASSRDSSRVSGGQQQAARNHDGAHGETASGWEHDSFVEVPVTSDGLCNAVLIWFEADLGGGHSLSSWHGGSHSLKRQPADGSAAGTPDVDDHGCSTGSDGAGERHSEAPVNGHHPDGLVRAAVASSWSQGIQYLDGVRAQRVRSRPSAYSESLMCYKCSATSPVDDPLIISQNGNRVDTSTQGKSIELRVRQDAGQLHFASDPPQRRPRHAYLPRWHFDMVRAAHSKT